jgi:hypothetical protein
MDLSECEDQSWFKVQAVPLFGLIAVRCLRVLMLKTTVFDNLLKDGGKVSSLTHWPLLTPPPPAWFFRSYIHPRATVRLERLS